MAGDTTDEAASITDGRPKGEADIDPKRAVAGVRSGYVGVVVVNSDLVIPIGVRLATKVFDDFGVVTSDARRFNTFPPCISSRNSCQLMLPLPAAAVTYRKPSTTFRVPYLNYHTYEREFVWWIHCAKPVIQLTHPQ